MYLPDKVKQVGRTLTKPVSDLPLNGLEVGTTSGGRETIHYFCIACDKFRANNARSRAFEHADQCNVSIKSIIIIFYYLKGLEFTFKIET